MSILRGVPSIVYQYNYYYSDQVGVCRPIFLAKKQQQNLLVYYDKIYYYKKIYRNDIYRRWIEPRKECD